MQTQRYAIIASVLAGAMCFANVDYAQAATTANKPAITTNFPKSATVPSGHLLVATIKLSPALAGVRYNVNWYCTAAGSYVKDVSTDSNGEARSQYLPSINRCTRVGSDITLRITDKDLKVVYQSIWTLGNQSAPGPTAQGVVTCSTNPAGGRTATIAPNGTIALTCITSPAQPGLQLDITWQCDAAGARRISRTTDARGQLIDYFFAASTRMDTGQLCRVNLGVNLVVRSGSSTLINSMWTIVEPRASTPPAPTQQPVYNVCVGAFTKNLGLRGHQDEYEAYVTRGSCQARTGGHVSGAQVTLRVLNRFDPMYNRPQTRTTYVNYNRKTLVRVSGDRPCASAFATVPGNSKMLSKSVCGKRSFD